MLEFHRSYQRFCGPQEWKSRRSRNENVNQFVKGLLGSEDGTADELFHVSRANLWTFFKRHLMSDSAFARRTFTLVAGALIVPGDASMTEFFNGHDSGFQT